MFSNQPKLRKVMNILLWLKLASHHGIKEPLVRQQLWARRVQLTVGKDYVIGTACIVA